MNKPDNSKKEDNSEKDYVVWVDELEKDLEELGVNISDFNLVEVNEENKED